MAWNHITHECACANSIINNEHIGSEHQRHADTNAYKQHRYDVSERRTHCKVGTLSRKYNHRRLVNYKKNKSETKNERSSIVRFRTHIVEEMDATMDEWMSASSTSKYDSANEKSIKKICPLPGSIGTCPALLLDCESVYIKTRPSNSRPWHAKSQSKVLHAETPRIAVPTLFLW